MRSRYAAYALGRVEYIVATTDPTGPQFRSDREVWAGELTHFCQSTRFDGLEVLDSGSEGDLGWVSFRARLSQNGKDASFVERSRFRREQGRWAYHSGTPIPETRTPQY